MTTENPQQTPPSSSLDCEARDGEPSQEALEKEIAIGDGMSPQTSRPLAESFSLPHEILFVGIICTAQMTTQVGLGQALIILHDIGRSFNITNPVELTWLIAGYSLTVGTFILVSGRLGDMFGYKRMMIIGYAWFSVWSMIAGLAIYSNHVLFVFARVFQGIGPAILLPNGVALLGASYANGSPRKDMVFALFGACAPGGSIIGCAFAGLFALTWWPWAFFSFAIALAALAVASYFVIPSPPPRPEFDKYSLRQKIGLLDLPGAAVGITALVLFNFAWNQAPIVGWQKAYVYVTMIIGILLVPLFFYIELRVSKAPLVPFDALTVDVGFVLSCIVCGWSSFGIWVLYLVNFLEILRGASPLLTVAYMSPVAVSGACASVVTGILLSKLRPAMVMTIALTWFTVGHILVATTPVHQTYWAQTFVCLVVIPWGMDMSFPAATIILSNAVRKEHQGIAASLVTTIVNYSISLGLGFAGTVEVHVNRGGRTPHDILLGYRGAWYLGIGFAGLGLCISIVFLLKDYIRVNRKKNVGTPD
ncbi:uncharacterized protein Z520_07117 [Fonsecaea multimorphosa CBS 102226]|uniref:Major facilitator superfamily (MFS) profile domain-containing protein n=1 Tax=Fonsecaea multimorphosa CBS 102226 TaxID=1442371 RepID=A0A0D2KK69_9EURO|nr:uncharacterized protein Z520_07117 [Fonsecaea multimorphosa CBS 102226]KIX97003.1 hypothetical protein Z520_07117 [Fonsecaea multimorphosa CBS 102226]OAL22784.1 hypothetical protein AYO22_06692 [Fonsecaea multimorphosa]